MNCKMISFDTSSTDTGYAVWEDAMLVRYGHFSLVNIADAKTRTDFMMQELFSLISSEKPNIIVVEGLTVFNNIKTDSNLSDIIGAMRGYANICENCWFDKLMPSEWRSLVSDGSTIPRKRIDCKVWDIERLNHHYKIETTNDNIADAILVGLAYCRLFSDNNDEYLEDGIEEDNE